MNPQAEVLKSIVARYHVHHPFLAEILLALPAESTM